MKKLSKAPVFPGLSNDCYLSATLSGDSVETQPAFPCSYVILREVLEMSVLPLLAIAKNSVWFFSRVLVPVET